MSEFRKSSHVKEPKLSWGGTIIISKFENKLNKDEDFIELWKRMNSNEAVKEAAEGKPNWMLVT